MRSKKHLIKEKRHRLPREHYRGEALVVITACIAGSRQPFTAHTIVQPCVQILEEAATTHHCAIPIYCFMPDHVHLMIQGLQPTADMWRVAVLFKQRTGFLFSQAQSGSRWQKDFYDHIVRSDEDWQAQVRYIANNPVRADLAEQWNAYPFTGSIGHDLYVVMDGAAQRKIR